MKSEIKEHGIDKLKDGIGTDEQGCELHHKLYNEDYFIIGYYQAEQFMGDKAFECIGKIQDYEKDNFGEVITDLSDPEKVVNMYAYIIGEEILAESDTLRDKWDNYLSEEDVQAIIEELE